MTCQCGEPINPILGEYPKECAVCRLMHNFCAATCDVFKGGQCSCGGSLLPIGNPTGNPIPCSWVVDNDVFTKEKP